MKKLVVFTGAGISAESGLKTFRDANGLWEEYNVMDVASIDAWYRDPQLVLRFYNQRRTQLGQVLPNAAHIALGELEKHFKVMVITQNVDDLHERGGSKNIIHLHGELRKVRSTEHPSLIYDIGYDEIGWGDTCDHGAQLRPHIVWFGEEVPQMEPAISECLDADIFIVIGTSLEVYPAASLVYYVPDHARKFYIDPKATSLSRVNNLTAITKTATEGMKDLMEILRQEYNFESQV